MHAHPPEPDLYAEERLAMTRLRGEEGFLTLTGRHGLARRARRNRADLARWVRRHGQEVADDE